MRALFMTAVSNSPPIKTYPCAICFEDKTAKDDIVRTTCNHIFCRACIERWATEEKKKKLEIDCPQCRWNIRVINPGIPDADADAPKLFDPDVLSCAEKVKLFFQKALPYLLWAAVFALMALIILL